MKKIAFSIALGFIVLFTGSVFAREPLTFEERIKAQEAIERVYYNHRIWPKENPGPKPPFETMVTKEQIEAKVTDYLKKSAALDQFWQRPIEGKQLQAEMDRMAKGTKDPQTLNELFKALNDDPYLIAECLAKPVLADRLVRNWYANDERFHKETREKAENAVKQLTPENLCRVEGGHLKHIRYVLLTNYNEWNLTFENKNIQVVPLSEEDYERVLSEIPKQGMLSELQEKRDGFVVIHTLKKDTSCIEIETLFFEKDSMAKWLYMQQPISQIPERSSYKFNYYMPPITESLCSDGWDNGSLDDIQNAYYGLSTAVWTGTEMIVWGGYGYDGSDYHRHTNAGDKYNPSTDTWTDMSISSETPEGRKYHTAVWTGEAMIIWGGYSEINSYDNTGGIYSPVNDNWTSTSTDTGCPVGRRYHTAIWAGSEMIVWGGYTASSPSLTNTGGRYNPSTNTWTATSTGAYCPAPRTGHTAIWTNTEMIIWGGYTNSSPYYTNTGGRYNPSTNSWSATTGTNCPSARRNHVAIWTGNEMIIWGGQAATSPYDTNTGGRYNPSTNSWTVTSTSSNCPLARNSHTAIWTGSVMIIWGGHTTAGLNYSTGGQYNPSTNSWSSIATGTNCPSARYGHTTIWTGTEMIVWGGDYPSNEGGRYSPSTDSWITIIKGTTILNMPSRRRNHSAVWTGMEMIVWGGSDDFGALNTGGMYYPVTDSWLVSSSDENVPSAREGHIAIWTGSEMIIWGGHYINTGGRYNPTNDIWQATSTPPDGFMPSDDFCGVWTGSELLIWPDIGETYGNRYNPASDSWNQMSSNSEIFYCSSSAVGIWTGNEFVVWPVTNSLGRCGARYDATNDLWSTTSQTNGLLLDYVDTVIWTGNEMILWGGIYHQGSLGPNNNGVKYNPLTDTWVETSTGENVPAERGGHTVVWTGKEMLVWGGSTIFPDEFALNDGGKYSSEANSWVPMSMENAPSARLGHTAVWAGNKMIIWGGTPNSIQDVPLKNGGIYFPGPERPEILGGSFLNCNVSSVNLSIPDIYLNYRWLKDHSEVPGAISANYIADDVGTYNVRVTDGNGCLLESYPHYIIDISPHPQISGSHCVSSNITTQTFASYQWYRNGTVIYGATDKNYSAIAPGNYSVFVTDANDCQVMSPVFIVAAYPTTPEISGSSSSCSGVSLSTGNYESYQWLKNGSPIAGATDQTYYVTETGTYIYSVKVANPGGCWVTSAGKSVTVYPNPSPTISGSSSGCDHVNISTGTFLNYQWMKNGDEISGATSKTLTVVESGNYSVRVTDSNGCSGVSGSQYVVIYSYPEPNVIGNESGCWSTELSTEAYSSYQWKKNGVDIAGATSQNYLVSQNGSYSVRVSNDGGCQTTSPEKDVVIYTTTPGLYGDHFNSCPIIHVDLTTDQCDTYQWYMNGAAITVAMSQTYQAKTSGNYQVMVTKSDGCSGISDVFQVFIDFCPQSEVSPSDAVYPVILKKDDASATGFYIYFQRLDSLDGYNIYEGDIVSPWDGIYHHENKPGNICQAIVDDLGTGEMRAEISPSEGNHYYLVTAYGGGIEGPSGYDSQDVEIEPLQSTCTP